MQPITPYFVKRFYYNRSYIFITLQQFYAVHLGVKKSLVPNPDPTKLYVCQVKKLECLT
jgi:hypothetical protein